MKPLSDAALDAFTGEYAMGSGEDASRLRIARAEGRLLVKFPFLPKPLVIYPIAETVFAMPDTDGQFTFQRDEKGQVKGAVFHIGDGERVLPRISR
jgi:hypothetical protein